MVTKGYGFTIDDIDWSCPADLEPYAKAYKNEKKMQDSEMWRMGLYVYSAVSTAIEHYFAKKSKSKYIEKPFMYKEDEQKDTSTNKESNEEIAVFEMKQRIKILRQSGLPESPK